MRALRMKDVAGKIGLGQPTLRRMIDAGAFPKPFELAPGHTAWLESDVDAWLASKAGAAQNPSSAAKGERERIDERTRGTLAKKRPEIAALNFHDSRHEATTRLSRKLHVLALAKMIGHRDIQSLMIYYDETAAELAARLD